MQGHTKFTNESGLFALIIRSRKKQALEITSWITHDVMPSLRKYCKYRLTKSNQDEINKLNIELDKLRQTIKEKDNKISVMDHNLKTYKYEKGSAVYIIRQIVSTMKL